jgi:hypothetical protein
MPSSPSAESWKSRVFALSAGVWLFDFSLLFSLWVGRASALDTSPPESKPSHNDSSEVISKTSEKKKVPSKYDVNHIGDRGVGNGANKYSLERERKLGHALAQHVELSSKLVTDPVIAEYLNRLGQRIVGNSDAQVPFTIKVIESDEINAFTLPGGYLYVDTGLILAADNEAEVAGVMAHEVAHVAARHETRAKTRKEIWRYASIPLVFGGLGVVTPMLFMKFGRDAEREADLLGLEYEYAAGYDPQAFIQFFEKLQTKEEQKQNLVAKAFATHPPTEDRIRRAQKEISSLLPDKAEYVVDTSEFQEVKARVANLTHEGPKDRCCFQANLWGPPHPDQDIRQVWFSGFHSDVGGSYSESEAGLSKVSFEWILVEAQKASAKKKSSTRSQSQIEKSL